MKRQATVIWKGSGKEGSGTISTQSTAISKGQYTWSSRFEDKPGTNPEELIGAAHAACFTMKLSFLLGEAGFTADIIETVAEVKLAKDSISDSHITVKATIPKISEAKFKELAEEAKENCLVSKALNMNITLDATLSEKITAAT